MVFDDLSLRLKVLVGLTAPPILTLLCWLVGGRLAGSRRLRTRSRDGVGFWLMLLAAYLIFALALASDHFFSNKDNPDPSLRMVQ